MASRYGKYVFAVILFWAQISGAAVWQHDSNRSWDQNWENRYSQWIQNNVQGDFFHRLGGSFARLKLDCADAHYALLAYFARENKLPFAVHSGRVTNLTTRFDHIGNAGLTLDLKTGNVY